MLWGRLQRSWKRGARGFRKCGLFCSQGNCKIEDKAQKSIDEVDLKIFVGTMKVIDNNCLIRIFNLSSRKYVSQTTSYMVVAESS